MTKDKKILWLSSYPKSGNTWIRLILCALFFTEDGKLNGFDLLKKIPSFDHLDFFEFIKSLSIKDYNKIFNCKEYNDESIITYSRYWIEAQKRVKINEGTFTLFKTHNARVKINNNYYTDSSTTAGFIYISRDPRDIVISRSAYSNIDIDVAINSITTGQVTTKEKINNKMPEITLNWGDHYLSWKKFSDVPSLFIKYEDLLKDVRFETKKIINFFYENYNIKIENQKNKINNVIESTKFKKLQKEELQHGYLKHHPFFFRVGQQKQWMEKINQHQRKLLEQKFKDQLTELNYL